MEKTKQYILLIIPEIILISKPIYSLVEGMMRTMETSKAFWKVFEATGHIGAYLLYKDYQVSESEIAAEELKDYWEFECEGIQS